MPFLRIWSEIISSFSFQTDLLFWLLVLLVSTLRSAWKHTLTWEQFAARFAVGPLIILTEFSVALLMAPEAPPGTRWATGLETPLMCGLFVWLMVEVVIPCFPPEVSIWLTRYFRNKQEPTQPPPRAIVIPGTNPQPPRPDSGQGSEPVDWSGVGP